MMIRSRLGLAGAWALRRLVASKGKRHALSRPLSARCGFAGAMWCCGLLLAGSIVLTPSARLMRRMVTECNCNCVCSIRLVEPVRTVCGMSWFPRRNRFLRTCGAQNFLQAPRVETLPGVPAVPSPGPREKVVPCVGPGRFRCHSWIPAVFRAARGLPRPESTLRRPNLATRPHGRPSLGPRAGDGRRGAGTPASAAPAAPRRPLRPTRTHRL